MVLETNDFERFLVFTLYKGGQLAPGKTLMHNFFCYFSTETYVVGTQKNRLNGTVLFSTQNIIHCMLKLMGKKIFTILCLKMLLSKSI